jgi:phenylacetate-CoA ligase
VLWYLHRALRRQFWDKRRLQAHQERRLRSVVKHAYDSVPFYREKFKEAGISPGDIKVLGDLSRLPVIEKDVIRREDPTRLVSTYADLRRLKIVRTTGSTGKPFQVFINHAEDDWRKAVFMRANMSCGQKPTDRWVLVTRPDHASDTTGLQRRIGIFAQTIISLYSDVSEQFRLVEKSRLDVLDGYSMWMHSLAKEALDRDIETIRPRIMFGSAELIDSASAGFMEKVFHAPFYDQFGCAEVDRTAWQCPEKTGYHMDVDSVITQFVDDAGQDVSPGDRGKVVYTSLFNYSMPLIRYAVGDVGVPSDEVCPCARALPLMKIMEGRTDSMLHLPNGRLLSPVTVIAAMEVFDLFDQIDEYRLVQKRIDLLRFYIRKKAGGVDENLLRDRLVTCFTDSLRINPSEVSIEVEFVDSIPMIGGKHRAIISEVSV